MKNNQDVRAVQGKILEIMKYIDTLCRANNTTYFLLGGTALGAVRHGGFIPWDDDLDIIMTTSEYEKLRKAFRAAKQKQYVLQEWRTTPEYLEYAKIRMNGTTFIEEAFKDRTDLHQGIYVDIMILHKVPNKKLTQKLVYLDSKFVTLYGLSQRNWKPKSTAQKIVLKSLKLLPCKWMAKKCYQRIYRYDDLQKDYSWCYWITPAKFRSGLFEAGFFDTAAEIPFEDTKLLTSKHIKEYLTYRYGDYMQFPPEEARRAAVHAMLYDTEKDYTEYLEKKK